MTPSPTNEFERVQYLRSLDLLDSPRDAALDRLIFTAAQIFQAPIAAMSLVDENRVWYKARVGIAASEVPRDGAFCAYTILEGSELVIEDALHDPRFAETHLVVGAPYLRFYAGVPLIADGGFRLGSLCVLDRRPRVATEVQMEHLRELSRTAMKLVSTQLRSAKAS